MPTDVLDLVDTGEDLEAAGSGPGVGDRSVEQLLFRLDYVLDEPRLLGAVEPYLPPGSADGDEPAGTVAGSASFRVAITT